MSETTSLLRAATQAEEDARNYGTGFMKVTYYTDGSFEYETADPASVVLIDQSNTRKSRDTAREHTSTTADDVDRTHFIHRRLSEIGLHPSMMAGEWM